VQLACTLVQGTAAALPIAQGRVAPRLGAGGARGGHGWGSGGDGAKEEAQDDEVTGETEKNGQPWWFLAGEEKEDMGNGQTVMDCRK
jgi:hypothetical protein